MPNQNPQDDSFADYLEIDNHVAAPVADMGDDGYIPNLLELDLPAPTPLTNPDALRTAIALAPSDVTPVVDAFMSIVTESHANASVQASGSLQDGTMAGVGFTSAEGYVNALRNGVKQTTADSYKQTLRHNYGFNDAQINALQVTIIPESQLPVGPGIVHNANPDAPSFESQIQRTGKGRESQAQRDAKNLQAQTLAATKKTLIAGLVAGGHGIVIGPGRAIHGVNVSATTLRETLTMTGRPDLAPRLKSSRAQFGEVMRTLNSNGLRAFAVTRKDVQNAGQTWPQDVVARWVIGQLDGSATVTLGSLGEKVMAADLAKCQDGTLEIRFVGGSEFLRTKVSAEFESRVSENTYNATNLLNWFRLVLTEEFHAIEWGSFIYIPGSEDQVLPIRTLIDAVKPLMGRTIAIGTVTSDEGLVTGLADGLLTEVQEIADAHQLAQTQATDREVAKVKRDNQNLTPDALASVVDVAARRAMILPGAASGLLRRLTDVASRIDGYATMLGEGMVQPARALLTTLRAALEPLVDDTSARFAALDMD